MVISPIQGSDVHVTQHFGERPDIYKQFGIKGHDGIDFRAAMGTPIYSPTDGIVTVQDQGAGGYGKCIRILNTLTENQITLGHLSKFNVVTGQFIHSGDLIGWSGNTGFSNGPHLHFGLRKMDKDGHVFNAGNGFAGFMDVENFIVNWNGLLKRPI